MVSLNRGEIRVPVCEHAHNNYGMSVWLQLADLSREAADDLRSDVRCPVLSQSGFSLFESMSAVEVMDSRMDQCYGANFNGMSASDIFETAEIDDATWNDVLFILVRLISLEIAFIQGNSLMETVFSCKSAWKKCLKNLQRATNLPARTLFAYSSSLVATLDRIFALVLQSDVYEDDDFTPSFREFIQPEQDAEPNTTNLEQIKQSLEQLDSFPWKKEIILLIDLRIALDSVILEVDRFVLESVTVTSAGLRKRKSDTQKSKYFALGSSPASTGVQSTAQSLALMTSRILDEVVTPNVAFFDGDFPTAISQAVLSSRLANLVLVAPPRKVAVPSASAAVVYLKAIADQLLFICTETNSWSNVEVNLTFPEAFRDEGSTNAPEARVVPWDYLFQFSSRISARNLSLLPRCFFFARLHKEALNLDLSMAHSMTTRGVPFNDIIGVGSSHSLILDWLSGTCHQLAWEILKGLCHSRHRILALRLPGLISRASQAVHDALCVDEHINSTFSPSRENGESTCVTWCTAFSAVFSTQVMDLYMRCLCELQLCALDEFDGLYWYYDYICSTQLHSLDKVRGQRFQQDVRAYEAAVALRAKQSVSKKNKKKAAANDVPLPPHPEAITLTVEDSLQRGRGMLCRGIFRVVLCARELGLIPTFNTELYYTTRSRTFHSRFGILRDIINPSPLAFEDFINALRSQPASNNETDTEVDSVQIGDVPTVLQGALTCFQQSRQIFDDLRKGAAGKSILSAAVTSEVSTTLETEALSLLKVTVASVVSTTKLLRSVESKSLSSSQRIRASYTLHPHFPLLELVEA